MSADALTDGWVEVTFRYRLWASIPVIERATVADLIRVSSHYGPDAEAEEALRAAEAKAGGWSRVDYGSYNWIATMRAEKFESPELVALIAAGGYASRYLDQEIVDLRNGGRGCEFATQPQNLNGKWLPCRFKPKGDSRRCPRHGGPKAGSAAKRLTLAAENEALRQRIAELEANNPTGSAPAVT